MMAAPQPRVLLSIGYGAGLRVSEVVKLKVKHIDKELGVIRVNKDRHVMLSPETHDLLKEWKVRTKKYDLGVESGERWLFPGRRKGLHLTQRQVTRLIHESVAAAGLKKKLTLYIVSPSGHREGPQNGTTVPMSLVWSGSWGEPC
jgi:integrase/recombinase XerD